MSSRIFEAHSATAAGSSTFSDTAEAQCIWSSSGSGSDYPHFTRDEGHRRAPVNRANFPRHGFPTAAYTLEWGTRRGTFQHSLKNDSDGQLRLQGQRQRPLSTRLPRRRPGHHFRRPKPWALLGPGWALLRHAPQPVLDRDQPLRSAGGACRRCPGPPSPAARYRTHRRGQAGNQGRIRAPRGRLSTGGGGGGGGGGGASSKRSSSAIDPASCAFTGRPRIVAI